MHVYLYAEPRTIERGVSKGGVWWLKLTDGHNMPWLMININGYNVIRCLECCPNGPGGHACCFRSAGGMGRSLSSLASCSRCNRPWKGEMHLGFSKHMVKLCETISWYICMLQCPENIPLKALKGCVTHVWFQVHFNHGGSDGISTMIRCYDANNMNAKRSCTHSFVVLLYCCIMLLFITLIYLVYRCIMLYGGSLIMTYDLERHFFMRHKH